MDDGATDEQGATYTIADYVRVEAESTIKHEFYDGVIRAMAGGETEHSVDEYVTIEQFSGVRHEYNNGQVLAMAGGTLEHARYAMELGFQVKSQLVGRSCSVYPSDLRVRVTATGLITYPDLSVFCASPVADAEDRLAHTNPIVLVEVTSDSSERYDRGGKFEQYKRIPSLREYVVVSHRERAIEVHRRADDGTWSLAEIGADGDRVALTSIGCVIDVSAVYANPHPD